MKVIVTIDAFPVMDRVEVESDLRSALHNILGSPLDVFVQWVE